MKSFMAKNNDVEQKWLVVDAEGAILGRMAAKIAPILMGKTKPTYTPHVDVGDFVIVVNAGKVGLTGAKAEQKFEKRYTGYPGGLKLRSYGQLRSEKPERLIELAVKRMLPKNRLGRQMIKKLKVYPGAEHPHAGVNPTELTV